MSTAVGVCDKAVVRSLAPWLAFAAMLLACWFATSNLGQDERLILVIYAGALAAWCLRLSEDWITGTLAVAAMWSLDLIQAGDIAAAACHDLMGLLIAAYLMAFAIDRAGLFNVLSAIVFRRPTAVSSLAYRVTALVAAMAFVFPATSARAAILLPVHRMLVDAFADERMARTFALLIPTVVLLSAGGVLTGAAAHVVALEIIEKAGGARVDYLGWLMLALPVALVTSFAAAWLVLRLFLDQERRRRIIVAPCGPRPTLGAVRARMLSVIAATVALWITSGWHGASLAAVGFAGAFFLALLASRLEPLALALVDMARAVDWRLLVLLVSTVLLAEALVASGAAGTIASGFMAAAPSSVLSSEAATVALVAALSMLAHVVIPSRSARAAVLMTTIAVPLSQAGFDIVSLALLIALGTGFCQLTPYGAKPLLIFASGTRSASFRRDLMLLGVPLFVVSWFVLVGFALLIWPPIGLFSGLDGNASGARAFSP